MRYHRDKSRVCARPGCNTPCPTQYCSSTLAERHILADQLDEQAAESNGLARFALEGFAQQLRGRA